MTYNFDPDKWYENEFAFLEIRLKSGQITEMQFEKAVELLNRQQEEMWKRLDGSYNIQR